MLQAALAGLWYCHLHPYPFAGPRPELDKPSVTFVWLWHPRYHLCFFHLWSTTPQSESPSERWKRPHRAKQDHLLGRNGHSEVLESTNSPTLSFPVALPGWALPPFREQQGQHTLPDIWCLFNTLDMLTRDINEQEKISCFPKYSKNSLTAPSDTQIELLHANHFLKTLSMLSIPTAQWP